MASATVNGNGVLILNVDEFEIVKIGGSFRYISHDDRIATHGFETASELRDHKGMVFGTADSLKIFRNRYFDLFKLNGVK